MSGYHEREYIFPLSPGGFALHGKITPQHNTERINAAVNFSAAKYTQWLRRTSVLH